MKNKTYTGVISLLPENGIFVFGSNTQGRHGKGAAWIAKEYFGAIYGQPKGIQGRSYAIVTKDLTKTVHPSIPPSEIVEQIERLYIFAERNPELEFWVAYSGTGTNLNGYTPEQMAFLFAISNDMNIPENMVFEEEFAKLMEHHLNHND